MIVTTPRHPRVARARRLAKRAFRYADRRFLAEGPQVVAEALTAGAVTELFVEHGKHADLVARAGDVPVYEVSGGVMEALAQTVTPQGVVAVASFRDVPLAEVLGGGPKLVVVLAYARDPGNAGTVLRAAAAAGAEAVVFTDSSVDPYNAKCVRSSAGALFALPFVVGSPVPETLAALKDAGLRVLAADVGAETDLYGADLAGPTAWVFGNEAWGLPPDVAAMADQGVRVPIHGRVESLNLATAAAVCLYASARAQRAPGGCRA